MTLKYYIKILILLCYLPSLVWADSAAMSISSAGMNAQMKRIEIIAQNIANVETTGALPGSNPYQRQNITFKNVTNSNTGWEEVQVNSIGKDYSDYLLKYEPWHPAANNQGYVKYPNVNRIVEMADFKEAQRSYEANLEIYKLSQSLEQQTTELLN